jgi:hypothetical protein
VKYSLLAVDDQRVTGIVTALEACDSSRAIREQIHDLSLAFITPLGADDNDILTHGLSDL